MKIIEWKIIFIYLYKDYVNNIKYKEKCLVIKFVNAIILINVTKKKHYYCYLIFEMCTCIFFFLHISDDGLF